MYNIFLVIQLSLLSQQIILTVFVIKFFQGFCEKAQKYQNFYSKNKMKSNSPYSIRQHIQMFMTSLIGTLQSKELMLLNMLDQAEFTNINSIKKLIGQLSEFIEVSICAYKLIVYLCEILFQLNNLVMKNLKKFILILIY